MTGKKRTNNGQIKSQVPIPHQAPEDITMTEPIPPCAQPPPPSSKTTESQSAPETTEATKKSKSQTKKPSQPPLAPAQNQNTSSLAKPRQKLPKLPPHTKLTKRPLLHPPIPSPFSNAASPKTLYVTASTPYIPTLKRVRKLLAHVSSRENQAACSGNRKTRALRANGRLEAGEVERGIAEEVRRRRLAVGDAGGGGGAGGEEIYLKATGRAIPRALEIGVFFQGEVDCRVGVEMGSVCAVDDVSVSSPRDGARGEEEEEVLGEEDIPETRMRTLSSVTVSIGLK
ncbi:hypothetical protein BDW02DRAFT_569643 [Decorospora gaudefroyi]|uniref:Uncharacterized protein n=1 Tax=Decorospora gaudefroyi TaxID=184978 RepID=A0A6A5KBY4_9PLEO|nr:hypothetical protein BDW02DRAFT_569643 [Decorospora gaudefroyi]